MPANETATKKQMLTLKDHFDYIAGASWRNSDFIKWAPDVFAICASLLERTGSYTWLVEEWPPCQPAAVSSWVQNLTDVAQVWRRAMNGQATVPDPVQKAWQSILDKKKASVNSARTDRELQAALLELTCLADQACDNFGLLNERDDAERKAVHLLTNAYSASSLCERVHSTRVQVLPKQHTPQSGISLRSLSHHLALVRPRGIAPRWVRAPVSTIKEEAEARVNVLCVPWPFEVPANCFRPVNPPSGRLPLMPPNFGFFEYQPPPSEDAASNVVNMVEMVENQGKGPVHLVVLPELALSGSDYAEVLEELGGKEIILVSGVWEPGVDGRPCKNVVRCDFVGRETRVEQAKHHRWQLEKSQIGRYELGLDTSRRWWEHCSVNDRQLSFITVAPQLTFCVMICEDLARQDPAPDIVRAVGPNLVIAVLLDGPQLSWRWPARYAAVLAEDPGSTVITLTSLGMVIRSKPDDGSNISRSIAMYRNPEETKPKAIEMPVGNRGVLLTFRINSREEWTADGRSDLGMAGGLTLECAWPVQ